MGIRRGKQNKTMQLKHLLRTLTIIHSGLLLSLIVFAIFAYSANRTFTADMNRQDLFIYIIPLAAAAGYFISQFLFKKQLKNITGEEKLPIKLSKYQSASVLRYALLEAPGLLALSTYFFSGNALYLVIAIALTICLFTQRPTLGKIKMDLPLTLEEIKQFDNL